MDYGSLYLMLLFKVDPRASQDGVLKNGEINLPYAASASQSLFEDLHRPSPSVSCSNTNSAWRGGVESRCGRTGIGRAMRRV